MIIVLTPDIEQALKAEAHKQGRTLEQLVLESLRERFLASEPAPTSKGQPTSLADLLEGHIGVLQSSEHIAGGARLSEETSQKFAAALAKRQRK